MKIHEYQARELFKEKGIPVPKGYLCKSVDDVGRATVEIGKPVVVKAQILVAGRGKAGGVKLASTPEEARQVAERMLGTEIKSIKVSSVLVVEAEKPEKELYIGFTLDRARRRVTLIASSEGGVDLEELARTSPDKIFREEIDPLLGLHSYQAREAAGVIGLSGKAGNEFASICQKIYEIFEEKDADLAESNPLAIRKDGSLVALDARLTLDDNAIYRHPEFKQVDEEMTPLEREAQSSGLAFVQLPGDIGIIGNGAGLVMGTLDVVAHYGGKPANFLDMGGGSSAESVYAAVRLCLKQRNLKAVFVNILGGITKCDDVANGLVRALKESNVEIPITVRMVGTNEEEGRRILSENGIAFMDSMETAAETVVKSSRS
ncbi:MAG: ADP-forming succinate--CoA ligase subunit beta [Nitrososphaerota archaeon]|nr:ADP-forming succinate--CoA ligase subunit beta [Nitrososphaerota archaeon]MDG6923129.1 ADP-forming succinate--CoA ligase subunit beta [Nitrososphaerota archaeon]